MLMHTGDIVQQHKIISYCMYTKICAAPGLVYVFYVVTARSTNTYL